ncbi:MAG: zf-TFIIB domain-containing protein [Azospira sp.]
MSSVELETPGFWSCLYCEGNWIPGPEVTTLLSQAKGLPAPATWAPRQTGATVRLTCPSCGPNAFVQVTAQGTLAHSCPTCHGIYLPKGALQTLLPSRPAGEDRSVETVLALVTIAAAFLSQ